MFDPREKIALFIDGANLYATSRALGFDIDYRKLPPLVWRIEIRQFFPRSPRDSIGMGKWAKIFARPNRRALRDFRRSGPVVDFQTLATPWRTR